MSFVLHKLVPATALLMVSSVIGVAYALPSDANEPIRLLADKATYSERTGVTSYSGNITISVRQIR